MNKTSRVYRLKVPVQLEMPELSFPLTDRVPEVDACPAFRIAGTLWRTSPVFETYWKFAVERQQVYFRRLENRTPYTNDPILRSFKFTNAYRAADRVSQFLLREVIYNGNQSAEDIFFRTMLFKLFNKIDTWHVLTDRLGEIRWSPAVVPQISEILNESFSRGERIYSAAYIMPSGGSAYPRKHDAHLALLLKMMKEGVPKRLHSARSMKEAFQVFRSQPMLGDFLAYQFVTDINYSVLSDFSEMEFVLAGPGARDGIRKCFPDLPMHLASEAIKAVCESQEQEFRNRGLNFRSLWGRPLQLIDCQNLFCEVDKYSRLAHPEIIGISGRTRIKQQFRPTGDLAKPFFPPKWGLSIT